MTSYLYVVTTWPNRSAAERLGDLALTARLAACVQIQGPIASRYRWQGKLEAAEEWVCILKSRADLFPELEHCIREHHSYAVPEIIALPITLGSVAYLEWMDRELLPRNAQA